MSYLDQLRHTGAEFLIADLETAVTFADIALNSTESDVIGRNRGNALTAYRTVAGFAAKSPMNEEDAGAVSALLARLKEKLALLGATVE